MGGFVRMGLRGAWVEAGTAQGHVGRIVFLCACGAHSAESAMRGKICFRELIPCSCLYDRTGGVSFPASGGGHPGRGVAEPWRRAVLCN